MKYRIKITSYADGSVVYNPQVYTKSLSFFGYYQDITHIDCTTRESALNVIDEDYKNNNSKKIKSIEFEYINK